MEHTQPLARPTKHVIFIHGLLGSELVEAQNPETVHWGNSTAILRLLFLPSTPLSQVDGTRLVTRGLTPNYQSVVRGLRLHLRQGATLEEYIYDWRLGVRDASAQLQAMLEGAPEGTAIVAHSYGGLVALYGLASGSLSPASVAKLNRIVLIASPVYGSTFALLGLGQSLDFVKRLKPFLPVSDRWRVDWLLDRFPELFLRRLVPIFFSFQSMFDMIPHDINQTKLRLLRIPGTRTPQTSERWPYWGSLPGEARRRKDEARAAQAVIRANQSRAEIVSIFSSAVTTTPHFCSVGAAPRYELLSTADEHGDGIVAACCACVSSGVGLMHDLSWSDLGDGALGHSEILHHRRTHELLEELLA